MERFKLILHRRDGAVAHEFVEAPSPADAEDLARILIALDSDVAEATLPLDGQRRTVITK